MLYVLDFKIYCMDKIPFKVKPILRFNLLEPTTDYEILNSP